MQKLNSFALATLKEKPHGPKTDILNKQESASLTAASDDDIHGTVKSSPEESGSGALKARAGG